MPECLANLFFFFLLIKNKFNTLITTWTFSVWKQLWIKCVPFWLWLLFAKKIKLPSIILKSTKSKISDLLNIYRINHYCWSKFQVTETLEPEIVTWFSEGSSTYTWVIFKKCVALHDSCFIYWKQKP